MSLLITYVALALVVSFICSIMEAVLLSITPAYVALLDREQDARAARVRAYRENIDRPLAAILSLNTVAHTVGAAGAGAQAARVFGSGSVGIFSAALTLAILFGTEIVPKTLGAVHWKRLVGPVTRLLAVLVLLMWPLVKAAQWLTRLLTPGADTGVVSRDEISALAEEGEREGVVAEGESRVLRNLLRLAHTPVREIMTPVAEMMTMPDSLDLGTAMTDVERLRFSRIPLVTGEKGRQCTGYVLKDEILERAARDEHPLQLSALRREIVTVADDTPVPDVFDTMLARREHIALALDHGGAVSGLVTLEDVMEALLGLEILDEVDDAVELPDTRAQQNGAASSAVHRRQAV